MLYSGKSITFGTVYRVLFWDLFRGIIIVIRNMLVITVQIVKYMLEEIHPIVIRDMLKENNAAGNYRDIL